MFWCESFDLYFLRLLSRDTVSVTGVVRNERPGTNDLSNICYMRHRLALDECRRKFEPEYVCGGQSVGRGKPLLDSSGMKDPRIPRVTEVYLPGSHTDMCVRLSFVTIPSIFSYSVTSGGGNVDNTKLNNTTIPVLYMVNQSSIVGLDVTPSNIKWDEARLRTMKPTNSMKWYYRILEIFPIRRLTYRDGASTTR